MTDEQINRAIAEACGWEDGVERYVQSLPLMKAPSDYCTDLNAMHEAEKVLCNRLSAYGEQLCEMTVVSKHDFPSCYIWHATARQRAEAFLRALDKWEEVAK